ncbi:MAG TPA: NAD(P)H-binding protein [Chryseosolibacter sp.]|nr:NAD(P)H-binding protein [Chryseosolibacter sp.]
MKTAVVAGATGLIGNLLVIKLVGSPRYESVITLTRKSLPSHHPKVRQVLTDFHDLPSALSGVRPDDVFCCLGTTMAKAGSKNKFYEVDFEYPFALAKVTRGLGAKQYLLVSALGADRNSKIYYNRVKGEAESAIRTVGFDATHIFRPSLLLGQRTEKRTSEDIGKFLFKVFGFAIPEKYKAIDAAKVAEAMLATASKDQKGTFIHESREMQN